MKVTTELQDAVRSNPKIKNVFFDKDNNHYFTKHSVEVHTDDGRGFSDPKLIKTVDSLPGVKSGILQVKQPNGKIISKRVYTGYQAIEETMSREDVLAAKPVANANLTERDEDNIIRQAQEILKKRAGLLALASAEVTEEPEFDQETYEDYKKNFNDMPDADVIAHFGVVSKAKGKNKSKFCEEERKALNEVISEKKLSVN